MTWTRVFDVVGLSPLKGIALVIWLRRAGILGVGLYCAILGAMYVGQRSLFFATDDGGALAAANGIAIADSERVTLATSDGERIAAWYVAPKANKPVFLYLAGKSGRLVVKKWRWARIRKRGYGVLAISYRGYPGSTGRPSETGFIRDAETAYRWLRQRYPAGRIVIHGLSMGSGVGVALAKNVDARALILEAPFTAAVDLAGERYPFIPVHLLMRDPFLSRERIAHINMPLLIVHGTRDSVIPFAHGRRLFELAVEPKTFIAMPGSDHATLTRDGLYQHIWKFLEGE